MKLNNEDPFREIRRSRELEEDTMVRKTRSRKAAKLRTLLWRPQ